MDKRALTVVALACVAISGGAHAQSSEGVEAGTGIYRVVIADELVPEGDPYLAGCPGAFTGPSHPVTPRMTRPAEILALKRINAGADGWNVFGLATVRLWDQGVDVQLGTNSNYHLAAEPGFSCINANEPTPAQVAAVPGDPTSVTARWFVSSGAWALEVERLMRVHGADAIDSRIEVSVTVHNRGSNEVRIGLRDAMALRLTGVPRLPSFPAGTTSSRFLVGERDGSAPPEPYEDLEHEWIQPAFQMWQASSSFEPSLNPLGYLVGGPLRGLGLQPPVTPPDVLQHTALGENVFVPGAPGNGAADSCFRWPLPVPPRTVTGSGISQMVMLYTWGHTPATARIVPPGGEISFTHYLVAFDQFPLSADAGADQEVPCDAAGGATAALAGLGATIAPTASAILYRWSASDPAITFDDATDPDTLVHLPGVGDHVVTLTTGVGAFEAEDTVVIRVTDVDPPLPLDLVAVPSILWPPNHVMRTVNVQARVEDACDPAPALRLVSVTSSEPADARGNGDGATAVDIGATELGTDDRSVALRAERAGGGAQRTYTLTYEAVDATGNTRTGSVDVVVPHDQAPRTLRTRR